MPLSCSIVKRRQGGESYAAVDRGAILREVECFCGCGTKVHRRLTEINLQASEVALELLAWDKARATALGDRPNAEGDDLVLARGADCYKELISALHGEAAVDLDRRAEAWLGESRLARRDRAEMTEKGSFFKASKVRLTDADCRLLDRAHPERSFSGLRADRPRDGARHDPDGPEDDPVAQLEGLRELHGVGALTDAEFKEAKARVISKM